MTGPNKLEIPEEFRDALTMLEALSPAHDGADRDEVWLQKELTDASALYNSGKSFERDGVRRALQAVIEFVAEKGELLLHKENLLLAPLRGLSGALEKLDEGVVEKLLERAPQRAGARALSLQEREFRFVVALVAHTSTKQLEESYRLIAKRLNELGFKQHRLHSGHYEEISATTVRNWFRGMWVNWEIIRAARKLTLPQYIFRIGVAAPPSDQNRPEFISQSLLQAIPLHFGNLAV